MITPLLLWLYQTLKRKTYHLKVNTQDFRQSAGLILLVHVVLIFMFVSQLFLNGEFSLLPHFCMQRLRNNLDFYWPKTSTFFFPTF